MPRRCLVLLAASSLALIDVGSVASAARAAALPTCRTHQLRFSLSSAGVGGGMVVADIHLVNAGPSCSIRGYLGLSMLDARGRTLLVATRGGTRAPLVTLAHGASAHVGLLGTDRGPNGEAPPAGSCAAPAKFRVYAPDRKDSSVFTNRSTDAEHSRWSTCGRFAVVDAVRAPGH